MDCNMRRQWRNQQYQSEHLASAKIPRLFPEGPSATSTAFPLFVPKMSAFPDSTTTPHPRFAKMGSGLFSLGQWQELELQALIFKYMLAGAAVPAELIHSIKKSLLLNSPDQHLLHPVMQSGYWGRAFVDPEPGRCRRTDGKKWRCSRDVVGGHKYCERHVHRGRNRSRKHVEAQPTQSTVGLESQSFNSLVSAAALPLTNNLHLNRRSLKSEPGGNEDLLDNHNHDNALNDGKHQGPQVLRHFFDDWPKSQQQPNASPRLTMSISQADQSSNFFLKLSTSSGEDNCGAEQAQRLNWEAGWNAHSMGGPLAEALRSSTSGSPISVLHELPSGCRSQTSSAST